MELCYGCGKAGAAMVESYQKRNVFGKVTCRYYMILRRLRTLLVRLYSDEICLGNSRINVCHEARVLADRERHVLWSSMIPDFMEEAIPNFVSSSERHVLL